MHEASGPKNNESAFLAGVLLSIAVHSLAAAVFMQLAGDQPADISPRAIMVDVGNPPRTEKPGPKPVLRPDRKSENRTAEAKVKALLRGRPPVTEPAEAADQPVLSAAAPSDILPIREKPLPLPASHPEPSAGEGLPRNPAPPGSRAEPAVNVHSDRSAAAAYIARIREQIDQHKEYPVAARRGRLRGTVRIRCALARNGEVIKAAILGSSGYEILDNAALRAVRGAGRFPEVPAGVAGDRLMFDLPVVYRLAED